MLLSGVDGIDGLTRRNLEDSPLTDRMKHASSPTQAWLGHQCGCRMGCLWSAAYCECGRTPAARAGVGGKVKR
jgi:hypothetical protein